MPPIQPEVHRGSWVRSLNRVARRGRLFVFEGDFTCTCVPSRVFSWENPKGIFKLDAPL